MYDSVKLSSYGSVESSLQKIFVLLFCFQLYELIAIVLWLQNSY